MSTTLFLKHENTLSLSDEKKVQSPGTLPSDFFDGYIVVQIETLILNFFLFLTNAFC